MNENNIAEAKQKLTAQTANGHSWIGIFENADLNSPQIGLMIAFVFDDEQWDLAPIGTRSPDTATFIGWQYALVAKFRGPTMVDDAVGMLFKMETTTK